MSFNWDKVHYPGKLHVKLLRSLENDQTYQPSDQHASSDEVGISDDQSSSPPPGLSLLDFITWCVPDAQNGPISEMQQGANDAVPSSPSFAPR